MVRLATGVEAVPCLTPLQADVTELRLIASHAPRYNRRSKFPERTQWIKITEEAFPRLSVVRERPRRRRHLLRAVPPTAGGRGRRAGDLRRIPDPAVHPAAERRHADQRLRAGRDGPLLRAVRRHHLPGRLRARSSSRSAQALAVDVRPAVAGVQARLRRLVAAAAVRGGRHHPPPAGDPDPDRRPVPPGAQPGRLPGDRRRPPRGSGLGDPRDPLRPAGRAPGWPRRARCRRPWPGPSAPPPRPCSGRRTRCRPPASRRPSGSPTGWSSPAYG